MKHASNMAGLLVCSFAVVSLGLMAHRDPRITVVHPAISADRPMLADGGAPPPPWPPKAVPDGGAPPPPWPCSCEAVADGGAPPPPWPYGIA